MDMYGNKDSAEGRNVPRGLECLSYMRFRVPLSAGICPTIPNHSELNDELSPFRQFGGLITVREQRLKTNL